MRVLKDSFPVQVRLVAREGAPSTNHTFYAARAVVTETELLVAVDAASGPVLVFRSPHSTPSRSETITLDSPLYTTAEIRKDPGCGCGSRLRTWNPYRSLEA